MPLVSSHAIHSDTVAGLTIALSSSVRRAALLQRIAGQRSASAFLPCFLPRAIQLPALTVNVRRLGTPKACTMIRCSFTSAENTMAGEFCRVYRTICDTLSYQVVFELAYL